ncbi:MAG: glycerate kinase type-2 family protein, partial [Rectinemataceae bacterium]
MGEAVVDRGGQDAQAIFRAAVARVDPVPMMGSTLSIAMNGANRRLVAHSGFEEAVFELPEGGRILAIGMGKASARMALGLEGVLGSGLAGGVIAVKHGHGEVLSRLSLVEAGHPVPDPGSLRASAMMLDLGRSLGTALDARDLVIVLVSGGGSSILCAPALGLSLEDKIQATDLLLKSGASIGEVNCVRKHLSAVKGGQLARSLSPARVLSLVLSDVIGDDLDAIASGPTVPDPSTFSEALAIVRRYGLAELLTEAVRSRLIEGAAGSIAETPKPGDPAFAGNKTVLVGNNRIALAAAEAEAKLRGYECLVLTSRLEGEARELARLFLGMGKDISKSGFPLRRPACVIAGGETTVTVRGKGRGGRNQEMALAFLDALVRFPKDGGGLTFLSAGTDGNDGPTDAAGACVDRTTLDRVRFLGLDPASALADNDSYGF